MFVVETKSYDGRVRVSWGKLRVAGRDKTAFIDQAHREAEAVATVVWPHPVTPLICFHRADLGLNPWPMELDGVRIVGPRGLRKRLEDAPDVLDPDEIEELANRIEKGLKPAAG